MCYKDMPVNAKNYKSIYMVILESHCSPRLHVHSQESKPESCMTIFCIISDIRPISDMYQVAVYILYIHTHSYYNIQSTPFNRNPVNRNFRKWVGCEALAPIQDNGSL